MAFQNPEAFYLLIFLFPMVYFLWRGKLKTIDVISAFKSEPPTSYYHLARVLMVLILITSLIMIAARPYSQLKRTGDILFLVDISRSMQARNSCSQPSYLDRAKIVMKKIISDIPEARFGIFVYERLAFPITHMTFDHLYLDTVIEHGLFDGLIFDRTSTQPGRAFLTIAGKKQRLPELYGKIKFIVLLTDGNLTDAYQRTLEEPLINLDRQELTVLPVGIGNFEPTAIPIKEDGKCVDKFIVKEDKLVTIPLKTDTLQFIATSTGGSYFGESESDALVSYLRENALEETFVDSGISQRQRTDISWIFLIFASLAMFVYMLLDTNIRVGFKRNKAAG